MSWVVGPIEQSELEYLFLREPFIVSGSFLLLASGRCVLRFDEKVIYLPCYVCSYWSVRAGVL
jgi:hypothetical protein